MFIYFDSIFIRDSSRLVSIVEPENRNSNTSIDRECNVRMCLCFGKFIAWNIFEYFGPQNLNLLIFLKARPDYATKHVL